MKTDRFSWLRIAAYGALLLLCLAFYSRAEAQTAVTPYITAQPQFFDNNGNPLASGCVFTYQAGTSTPQATYTDSTGTVQNANPVILNAAGYAPSAIWFIGSAYKIQVKSFGGTACASGSTIRTEDSLQQKYFRYDGASVLTPIADLSAALGEFWLSSTNAGFLKWSDASAIHTVVGADSTQTLSNKTLSALSINNVVMADQQSGADACLKLKTSLGLLPSTGGIVDGNGFQGSQTCSTNPFISQLGQNKGGTMRLGGATFKAVHQIKVPQKVAVVGIGRGDGGTTGTVIQADATFVPRATIAASGAVRAGAGCASTPVAQPCTVTFTTTSTPALEIGDDVRVAGAGDTSFNATYTVASITSSTIFVANVVSSTPVTTVTSSGGTVTVPLGSLGDVSASPGTRLENITFDCNNICDIAIYSDNINEQSGLFHFKADNALTYGVLIEKARYGGAPQNWFAFDGEIDMEAGATSGFTVLGAAGTQHGISNVTVVNNGLVGTAMASCFDIENSPGGFYSNLHGENCTDIVLLGASAATSDVTVAGVSSVTGASTVTNVIHLSSAFQTQNMNFSGIHKGTATNTFKDDGATGRAACTSTSEGSYIFSDGNPENVPVVPVGCNPVFTGGPNFKGGITFEGGGNILSGQVWKWNSDTGLSRFGVAGLALGSSAQGATDGTLQLRNLQVTGATSGNVTVSSPAIAGSGTVLLANGTAGVAIPTSFTTTAATTDNVTVTGATSSSHCTLVPTNSGAAGGVASVFVSAKAANQITVTHTATAGWTFDVLCTPN